MTGDAAPAPLALGTAPGRWLVVVTVLASGMAFLDATAVQVALPTIGREFGSSLSGLQWTVTGYTLPLAALILLGGSLGDRYGRRRVFVIGVVWFAAASLLCGLAQDTGQLVAARALQGIGGALLTPGSLALIQSSFRTTDRARAIGLWSALGGIAGLVGPFLGGVLVDAVSWRLVFLINVPIAVVIVAVAGRQVPESRNRGLHGRFDHLGAVLGAAALGGTTYALIAAAEDPGRPDVPAGAVIGVLSGIAFVVRERRAADPMLPLGVFADRQFTGANVATLAIYGALGGDYSFQKYTVGWDAYQTVYEDLLDRKTVLGLHANVGFISGESVFFERFYGGGIGSVRGFQFRGISPRQGRDDDAIGGGVGNDLLTGDDGNDQLYGEDGDDLVEGGFGNDLLVGGFGGDRLYGQDGDDQLHGEAGADLLVGGLGADFMIGGADDDLLYGEAGADVLGGGTGNDRLFGQEGGDQLYGEDGDDLILGGSDNDLLAGGTGADRLYGEDGDDLLLGGTENDLLGGGIGNDRLYGEAGDDFVYGEDGADLLEGGAGNDQLFGGSGDDLLVGGIGNDRIDGGDGIDTAVFAGARSGYTVTTNADGSVTVVGADGTDLLFGIERLQFDDGAVGLSVAANPDRDLLEDGLSGFDLPIGPLHAGLDHGWML